MAGVRMHHPNPLYAGCTLVIELPSKLGRQIVCPACSTPEHPIMHDRKAVHLRLDARGDVIVAPEVLARAREQFALVGLEVANEVPKPPELLVGAVASPTQRIVTKPLNADQAPAEFHVPGRTKYESRDNIQRQLREALARSN